ncbi:oxygen-dependent protoporphyrinogen oxidase [Flavimobilis soli]|uniref:Oxygen-dependent protoporphyrinogen oxidase n=1 Tax=Flavimobilis soli TaxID=442709 RepID=A0A2A9EEH5_9MICO|nr:FAD-dependent oxidoreductase [Flavimobilis soli]PFG37026.1 oxygen-dependent protoporphyrinogen oxidase [Flavimobilis soli]
MSGRAVVVGGGVAGLVLARDLARAGRDVVVLEAREHAGGCVGQVTVTRGGIDGAEPQCPASSPFAQVTLDAGAESFATRSPAVPDLLAELGLADDVVAPSAASAWVRSPDVLTRLPRSGVLGIPGDLADVRRALGTRAWLRARLDAALPARVGTRGDAGVSVGHLVRARLGTRVLRTFVAPVAGGVHSTSADLLDVDAVAPGLRDGVARHGSLVAAASALRQAAPAGAAVAGLRGGMHRMVTALLADLDALGVEVRTATRVARLERTDDGWAVHVVGPSRPGSFEAAVGASSAATVEADDVVVATTSIDAGRLLAPYVPAETIPPVPRGHVNLVTLVLDAPALDAAPRGTGVLVAAGTNAAHGIRAKALTHASAKWSWVADALPPGHHVLRLSYGRLGGEPDPGDASATSLERTALHDAGQLLGVPLTPAHVVGAKVVRFASALPFAATGHRARVARLRDAVGQVPGLHVAGAWVAGTGLSAVVADARRTAAQMTA